MHCRATPQNRSGPVDPPALFALLTAILVCSLRAVLDDGDTYTHLAAGSWMLEHGAVLRSDPLSATAAGHPWVAHEWLAEVLLAAAYRLAGLTGVVLLTAAAVAAAFAGLARHVGRWCSWTGTVLLTAAALLCVTSSITARPHILALPLLEVWVAGLLIAWAEQRAPPWWLLGVMAVWANLHGGFAFGIALAVPFAVATTLSAPDRVAVHWWAFVAGALGIGLLTPQGWDGLLFPWRLMQLRSLAAIQEWQPANFAAAPGFEIAVLGLLALLATGRVQLGGLRTALLLGLLHLALMHARHGLLFGVAGALILAEPVGRAFPAAVAAQLQGFGSPAARRGICWAAMALTLLLRLASPVAMADGRATPVSALAQMPIAVAGTPVLNSYQFGGYLALEGLRPFVDGRADLFGDAFLAAFQALAAPDGAWLRQSVDAHGIEWALLAVDDPLVERFERLGGWRRSYADGVAAVFVRE